MLSSGFHKLGHNETESLNNHSNHSKFAMKEQELCVSKDQ